MSKITFDNRRGRITIANRLSYPEAINERVYNAIASGMFEGLLPLSIYQKRKETVVECVVQGLIPLNQYFNGIVTKKMFLDFVHEIAQLIKNCEKNMINANNLDLQSDKIFIDPQTKSVKCIFWPVVNNQLGVPPHIFLNQLPYELNFYPNEDNAYLETYKAFFSGMNPFSVNSFDRMVLKLSGKSGVGYYTTPSEALSGALKGSGRMESREPEIKNRSGIEYDPFGNSFGQTGANHAQQEAGHQFDNHVVCRSCGAKNRANSKFCMQCGTKFVQEAPQWQERSGSGKTGGCDTMALGEDTGGTTVVGYDVPEQPIYPILHRIRTEEKRRVDKPVFRIGTEQSYCDFFICDNTFISRSHADIVTRSGRYYIVDRNSTNRTFIDGKVIPAEREIEIFAGTKIRLANEDFIFNIES